MGKYLIAFGIGVLGLSYAAVPLYRIFCQMTGYGGTTQEATEDKLTQLLRWKREHPEEVEKMRQVRILFNADVNKMAWDFKPSQDQVVVRVGEPALAFFTAKNRLDRPSTGVATYNVTPPKAGLYFNKVQCFCFDEQRLRGGEEVEMPVWFFLDPEFASDRAMKNVNEIILSYTFWPSEVEDPEEDDDDDDEPLSAEERAACPIPGLDDALSAAPAAAAAPSVKTV